MSLAANEQRSKDLRLRVIEHNVMVVAKYYTRVGIKRLSQMLDLPPAEAEKQLSDLVVSKAIDAKVDRPSGIIQFGKRKVRRERRSAHDHNHGILVHIISL